MCMVQSSCVYLPPSHLWTFKWAENIPPSFSEGSANAQALSDPPQLLEAENNVSRSCPIQLSCVCKANLRFSFISYGSSLTRSVTQHLFSWKVDFFSCHYCKLYPFQLCICLHTYSLRGANPMFARLQFHPRHLPFSDLPSSDGIFRTLRYES